MFKVYIDNAIEDLNTRILIVEENNGRRYIAKPITLDFEEVRPGDKIKPTLQINERISTDFLSAFLEGIQKKGIKLPDQSFTEGKLIATEKHLEDMRELVFKDGKNK